MLLNLAQQLEHRVKLKSDIRRIHTLSARVRHLRASSLAKRMLHVFD